MLKLVQWQQMASAPLHRESTDMSQQDSSSSGCPFIRRYDLQCLHLEGNCFLYNKCLNHISNSECTLALVQIYLQDCSSRINPQQTRLCCCNVSFLAVRYYLQIDFKTMFFDLLLVKLYQYFLKQYVWKLMSRVAPPRSIS